MLSSKLPHRQEPMTEKSPWYPGYICSMFSHFQGSYMCHFCKVRQLQSHILAHWGAPVPAPFFPQQSWVWWGNATGPGLGQLPPAFLWNAPSGTEITDWPTVRLCISRLFTALHEKRRKCQTEISKLRNDEEMLQCLLLHLHGTFKYLVECIYANIKGRNKSNLYLKKIEIHKDIFLKNAHNTACSKMLWKCFIHWWIKLLYAVDFRNKNILFYLALREIHGSVSPRLFFFFSLQESCLVSLVLPPPSNLQRNVKHFYR